MPVAQSVLILGADNNIPLIAAGFFFRCLAIRTSTFAKLGLEHLLICLPILRSVRSVSDFSVSFIDVFYLVIEYYRKTTIYLHFSVFLISIRCLSLVLDILFMFCLSKTGPMLMLDSTAVLYFKLLVGGVFSGLLIGLKFEGLLSILLLQELYIMYLCSLILSIGFLS
jgi:hypothetical protein